MTIIRVMDGENFIDDIEAEIVPAVGDTFSWEKHGPYVIQEREWHLPPGYVEDQAHTVTVRVKEVAKAGRPKVRFL